MQVQIQILLIFLYLCNICACLKTTFQCTTPAYTDSNEGSFDTHEDVEDSELYLTNKLHLNCDKDLIFIAASYYGHQIIANQTSAQPSTTCAFSSNDCIVNVDYIANECNGQSNCQISLDTQYLHSCKSYSDYLFILYGCIDAKNTVNICDNLDITAETDVLYFKTPNYPNEYLNNLNCKCDLNTNTNQIQFQTLEFDLEVSFDQQQQLTSHQIQNCNKDYLSINQRKYCSNLNSYKNLVNVQNTTIGTGVSTMSTTSLDLQFFSDDSLTRRGFWLKTRVFDNAKVCADNFNLVNNACVRIYDMQLTWFEAKKFCSSNGYELLNVQNFETSKQISHVLTEDQTIWIGMKHLNKTHWFNENNSVIIYNETEKVWWPWLEFDNLTLKKGTCVAKRKNGLSLEECYQSLQFACQYKLVPSSKKKEMINLKCGTYYNTSSRFLHKDNRMSKIAESVVTPQNSTNLTNGVTKGDRVYQTFNNQPNTKQQTLLNSISDKYNPDSKLFLILISSIILLIALINMVVIMILCRRRKIVIKEQNESKTQTTNSDHLSYATTTESDLLGFNYTNNSRQQFFTLNNNPNKNNSLLSTSYLINDKLINPDNALHVYETISISDIYGKNCAYSRSDEDPGGFSKYDFFISNSNANNGNTNSRFKTVQARFANETVDAKPLFNNFDDTANVFIDENGFAFNPTRSFNVKHNKNSNEFNRTSNHQTTSSKLPLNFKPNIFINTNNNEQFQNNNPNNTVFFNNFNPNTMCVNPKEAIV